MDDNRQSCGRIVAVVVVLAAATFLRADNPMLDRPALVTREPRQEIRLALRLRDGAGPVTFSLEGARKDDVAIAPPRGIRLDATTGLFTWAPTEIDVGRYEIEVAAEVENKRILRTWIPIIIRPRAVSTDGGPVGKLLREWYADGTAAGNIGDVYDNRDRDHSALHIAPFPQLDHVEYTQDQLAKRLDWAAQHTLQEPVTFGNSSTSAPVTHGGSNIRLYHMHPRGTPFLYQQYRANNIYMYPAHHDYPQGTDRLFFGDVYPANTPYLIASQGSSGSDQPFMRTVPLTLAAFRPEVKRKLADTGLLMPTLQMIFRSSNKHLKSPDEYLTGKAHPTVFTGSWVDDLKMVKAAHDLTLQTVPPMVQLRVVDEDEAVDGRDYFEAGKSEKLFDTPAAVARIVRGPGYVRRMVVSAQDSFDLNGKPLTYRWVVLRGDAKRIEIIRRNEAGSVVELRVPYHERQVVEKESMRIESNRVDIGVFVHNGSHYSAPGFVTFYSVDSEARTYDDHGRLLEIGYGAGEAKLAISDWPALFAALERPEGWAQELLARQFKPQEREAFAKIASQHRDASTALDDARARSKQMNEARQAALVEAKATVEKWGAAKRAHAIRATSETAADLAAASRAAYAADIRRRHFEFAAPQAQKDAEAATRKAEDILAQKQPGLEVAPRERIDAVLRSLRDDVNFSTQHRVALEELLAHAEPARRNAIAAARKRLVNFGLLKPETFALQPLRPGAASLTRYEVNLVRRYQAEVLGQLLYPKFVAESFAVNFVDQRLASRKEWRDIYHYDSAGHITGWTRHDKEGARDFTPEGLLVVEKDDRGRAFKARFVKYEPEWLDRNAAIHTIKMTLGDRLVTFEYGADGKRNVVREEKVTATK